MSQDLIQKLRDLIGLLQTSTEKGMRRRFKHGDDVRFFNSSTGDWDTGRVTDIRNKDTYTVENPDFESFLLDVRDLRSKNE
jgi:hypothetical protein